MPKLRIGPGASSDLIEIWSYIADDSVTNADAFIDKLYETIRLLARQPGNEGTATRGNEGAVPIFPIFPRLQRVNFFSALSPPLCSLRKFFSLPAFNSSTFDF